MRHTVLSIFLFAAILGLCCMGVVIPSNADYHCEDPSDPRYDPLECEKEKAAYPGAPHWLPRFTGTKIPITQTFKIELSPGYQSQCERIQKTDVMDKHSKTLNEFYSYSVRSDIQGKRLDLILDLKEQNLKMEAVNIIGDNNQIIDMNFKVGTLKAKKDTAVNIKGGDIKEKLGSLFRPLINYHLTFSNLTVQKDTAVNIKGQEQLIVILLNLAGSSSGSSVKLIDSWQDFHNTGFAKINERIVYIVEGSGAFEAMFHGEHFDLNGKIIELKWGGYFLVDIDSGQIMEINTSLKPKAPYSQAFQQSIKQTCEITGPNITAGKVSEMLTAENSVVLQKGLDAYKRGDYATALGFWKPLAKQGESNAQLMLGRLYEKGEGVPQDSKTAVKWFKNSADQGNAAAQQNLGWMYKKGLGVPQDHGTALKWFKLGANQGNTYAQHNLGWMYREGLGVPQDYKAAVKWYRLAAEQGNAEAQTSMGAMYEDGKGVPQEYTTALIWFKLAAGQGNAFAQTKVEELEQKIDQQQPSLTVTAEKKSAPSAEDARTGKVVCEDITHPRYNAFAPECLSETVLKGMNAAINAGRPYSSKADLLRVNRSKVTNQTNVIDDAKKAEKSRSSSSGDYRKNSDASLGARIAALEKTYTAEKNPTPSPEAYQKGGVYQKGLNALMRRDYDTALREWMPLAAQGDVTAQFNVGVMYERGAGLPQDRKAALMWYKRAAKQGYVRAQEKIDKLQGKTAEQKLSLGAEAYEKGDYATALEFWEPLAEQGQAASQYKLGRMYEKGFGVGLNRTAALEWYRLAAKQGHVSAQKKVQELQLIVLKQINEIKSLAEQGDAHAQHKLGIIYQFGQGIPKDYQKALKWYRLATDQGDILARFEVEKLQEKIAEQNSSSAATTEKTSTPSLKSSIKIPSLEKIEKKCIELGFTKGTEKHGDCVMKLYK